MILNRTIASGYYVILFMLVSAFVVSGCEWGFDEQKSMRKAGQFQSESVHSGAIIELKKVIKNNSSNKQARVMLARSYLETGQGPSAEKELLYARKLGVTEQDTAELLGNALLQQNKFNEVLQLVPLSITNDPLLKAKLMLIHGYAQLSLNNKEVAKKLFLDVKQSNRLVGEINIALARLAISNNEPDLANQHVDAALLVNKADIEAWLIKGQLQMAKQDTAGAQKSFENVIELAAQKKSPANEFRARLHLVQLALLANKLELARQNVESLSKSFPSHPLTKYFVGLIAFQKKDYETARNELEKVLSALPNDLKTKLLLGAVYYAQGSYEQANKHVSYFVDNVPTHIHARKMLAAIQMKLGRGGEAYESLKSALINNVNDAEMLAMVGRAAMYNNRTDEAIDYLKRAQSRKPGSSVLRTELAKAYMKKGAFDEAIDELKNVTGKDAKQTRNILIYAYLQKGNIKAAQKETAQFVKDSSGSPVSYTISGIVELAAGARGKAKKNFTKALDKQQDFVPALLSLARIAYEDGDKIMSESYFNKVLHKDSLNEKAIMGLAAIAESNGDLDKSVFILEQALVKNPKALTPAVVLGRYYLNKKQNDKALMVIESLAKHHQDNPNIQSIYAQTQLSLGKQQDALNTATSITKQWPDLSIGYIEQARVQSALNQNNLAENSLKKALKIKPDLIAAEAGLVSVYMKTGQVKKALTVSADIQKQHPKQAVGYILAGDIHMSSKNYAHAQKNYQQALTKQSSGTLANKLSVAYNRDGKAGKAIKTLNTWLKDNPNDHKTRMQLAITYSQSNKPKQAQDEYLSILKSSSDNVAVLNNLAILMMVSDISQALIYAEKAYRLKPGIPAIDDTYGWVLYKSGQFEKALPMLKSAAAKNNNPSIQYHYATVLSKTGDSTGAREILQDIVQKQFEEVSEAQKLLKSLKN